MKGSETFRAGTSGLVLTEPNKKAYPIEFQNKSRLEYYASQFNSIEINSSFYKIPRGLTYKKWSALVTQNFQFSVKLWRGITHEKEYDKKDLESFFAAIDCLGNKKGCLLIQFPAKTGMHINRLRKLLKAIRKLDPNDTWRLALEFRHLLWYNKDVYAILDEFKAALVLHDMPNSIPPYLNDKAPFVYLRFHGEKGDYRGSYSEHYLKEKAEEIRQWLDQGRPVYAYFNNTIGEAAKNLKTLNKMIG